MDFAIDPVLHVYIGHYLVPTTLVNVLQPEEPGGATRGSSLNASDPTHLNLASFLALVYE
jgi:hypothetical protein